MYKKKSALIIVFCFAMLCIKAQVTMTPAVPPSGVILKKQLWNILLVNNGANTIDVELTLVLSDAATNEPLLTASTQTFSLNSGTRQLQESDLMIQYDYLSSLITDRDPNGFLNVGEYIACYTLHKITHSTSDEIAEDCINLTVEPIGPPLLNNPVDGSINEPQFPQFNWLPPAPLNMFNNLTYDFVLVEVQSGQNAEEAVQQNARIYIKLNEENIFFNYPSSYTPLDTSKLYAWQITAKNNNQYAAQSEVWTFKVEKDSVITNAKDTISYVKLNNQPDASVSSCYGILKFVYNNDAEDAAINYKITSLEDEDLGMILKSGQINLKSGENLSDLPLLKDDRLIDNRTYFFQLSNSRNEIWSMKFIYHEPVH